MRRARLSQLFLTLAILACGVAWGQAPEANQAGEWKRASTTHRLAAYPKVSSDGRVWFQFKAPNAQKVQVRIGAASKVYDMEKDKDGVWNLILPYPGPGFQLYCMLVDGLVVPDPGSDIFYINGYTSGIDVPAPGEDYYLAKPVPHGDVREHWFYSKVTQEFRRMFVYTPPNYDADGKTRYPVLYLQHGAGENESEWTHAAHANFILDNLIAEKKATPMIVVMNNGFAFAPGTPMPLGPRETRPPSLFGQVLITEVIPDVDANFRTIADRDHRAMAGLSMGGMQTFQIGLANVPTLSYFGIFSGPPMVGTPNLFEGALGDAASFNKQVHLLWFGTGTTETAIYNRTKEITAQLEKAGIKYRYYESVGTAHEWQTWRRCLHEFAALLFKQ